MEKISDIIFKLEKCYKSLIVSNSPFYYYLPFQNNFMKNSLDNYFFVPTQNNDHKYYQDSGNSYNPNFVKLETGLLIPKILAEKGKKDYELIILPEKIYLIEWDN